LRDSNSSPPNKKRKTVLEGSDSEEDQEESFVDLRGNGGTRESTKLVEMSKEAAAFIESAFKTKLKNSDRVECTEKYQVPWLSLTQW